MRKVRTGKKSGAERKPKMAVPAVRVAALGALEFKRALGVRLVTVAMPLAFALLEETAAQGRKDLAAGLPVRREAIESAKHLLAIGGIAARAAPERDAIDLSTASKEELEQIIREGQAQINATIEGTLSSEVSDLF